MPPFSFRGTAFLSAVVLCFAVQDDAAVASSLETWKNLGLKIIQQPTKMDFGLTFTAEDPDGNRLRLFAPARRG